MDLFLMIFGAVAFSVSVLYICIRFDAWASGRKW